MFLAGPVLRAQIDPERRRLIQLGYNQPLEGRGPVAAYGFYYLNQPGFLRTNVTLRLALAPVYLDAELGFAGVLGPRTDLAIGLAGGGFADSYSEIRRGAYLREESFDGHGAEVSASLYHRFNPDAEIPLNGVARVAGRSPFYEATGKTAAAFVVPANPEMAFFRTGLRLGGREPTMTAPLAMEVSAWYEGHYRSDSGSYGFGGDRALKAHTHNFWGRALLKYTFPESQQYFDIGLTLGASLEPDRLSAYRLGGFLPFVSEFPLSLPGYYYQEITAERFCLLNGQYSFPLDHRKSWSAALFAAAARVNYLDGLEQPGAWHSGAGAGLTYTSPLRAWFVTLVYGHGFQAVRSHGNGAHQVGLLFQYDFMARQSARKFEPAVSPYRSRGVERIFR